MNKKIQSTNSGTSDVAGNSEVIEDLVASVIDSLPEGDKTSWWRRSLRFLFMYVLPFVPLVYLLILWLA